MIATKKDGGSEMKRKGTIIKAREAVLAAGKSAAERTKVLAGEVANAAATAGATAKAASTAAASAVLGTVATAIQVRAAQGANALAGEGAITARKRSRKGWLLRNALHQRRRPRKRKRPARLLKRNEYEREMCNVRVATVMDARASSLRMSHGL
jgi:hypothetical protein